MLKSFIREIVSKINPDCEQNFTVIGHIVDEKQSTIYQLTKTKIFIRFEPVYPLKIVFSDKVMQDYNKIFLLLLHIMIARWNLVSRL